MLAARGVSLGLGKINLAELNQLPGERAQLARLARPSTVEKPKYIVRKKADAKTVWAACRAVIFGCIVIAIGLFMAVIGYYAGDYDTPAFDWSLREVVLEGTNITQIQKDPIIRRSLKSMQYLGPILMGLGTFVLIIACVITLESRDKHAQVICDESAEARARRLAAEKRRAESIRREDEARKAAEKIVDDVQSSTTSQPTRTPLRSSVNDRQRREVSEPRIEEEGESECEKAANVQTEVRAEVHRAPLHLLFSGVDRYAPLADVESLLDSSLHDSPGDPPV